MTDSTSVASQIGPAIDVLAARLKVPAQFVWGILERQAYVEFATALFGLALMCVYWFVLRWLWRKIDGDNDATLDADGIAVFGGIIGAVGTLVAIIALLVTVQGVLNPQYYALHEILGAVK